MSTFTREKLGFFRRVFIKIGKKIMWWRAPKSNALLLNGSFIFVHKLFFDFIQDNEKVNEEWFLIGTRAGRRLVNQMFNLLEMMVSKSVEDLTIAIESAWYVFLNQPLSSIEYYPPDNEGVHKIIWTWDNCVMCTNIQEANEPEMLKGINMEAVAAGIFQVALQIMEDHVGNPYKVTVKNTKIRAWGDPCCEMTATFSPI